MAEQYGRTIDIAGSGAECPPEGRYAFHIQEVTDPEVSPGFQGKGQQLSSKVVVTLHGYKYDPNDEDDFDWNHHEITHFAKWVTIDPPDPKKPAAEPKQKAIYKSNRSTSGQLLRAIFPSMSEDDWKRYVLDLNALEGEWFSALLYESDSGWPRLRDFKPYTPKTKAAKPKPAPEPEPVQDEIDLELGDDDDDLLTE